MLEVIKNIEKEVYLGSINIPVFDLEKRATNRIPNKDTIIIAYCSAGIRSKRAIKILKKLGYTNLYNIEGGIENIWMKY